MGAGSRGLGSQGGPVPQGPATVSPAPVPATVQTPAQTSAPSRPVDPGPVAPVQMASGQVVLETETIQQLRSTLRALPKPLLESLTRTFRQRFQVPEAAPSIAGGMTLEDQFPDESRMLESALSIRAGALATGLASRP